LPISPSGHRERAFRDSKGNQKSAIKNLKSRYRAPAKE